MCQGPDKTLNIGEYGMFLSSVLRLSILGEPLLKPPQSSPLRLFVYEAASNLVFDIYLASTLLLLCAGVVVMLYRRPRNETSLLLYVIGFLLIFLSYNLQKAVEINSLLDVSTKTSGSTENRWFWQRWFSNRDGGKGRDRGVTSFFSRMDFSSFLVKHVAHSSPGPLVDSSRVSPSLDRGRRTTDPRGGVVVVEDDGQNRGTRGNQVGHVKENPLTESKGVQLVAGKGAAGRDGERGVLLPGKGFSSLESNELSFDTPDDGRVGRRETVLKNLLRLFEFKLTTDESLGKHILDLNNTRKHVNAAMNEFVEAFKMFMKEAEKIETEMLAFNAPIRYLDISLNELRAEIEKYFSNLPNLKTHPEIPTYLSALERNYRRSDGRGDVAAGDVGPAMRYENYIVVFFIVQVICCLVLFIAVLTKVDIAVAILKPVVSVFLIAAFLFNTLLLLNGQILDRNCKSGTVKGCSFTQGLVRESIGGSRRPEMMSVASDLGRQLQTMIEDTDKVVGTLKLYVQDIIDEKVSTKVSVFSSLFNKILFVYEDFGHLTRNKVNRDGFYEHIRVMNGALESITTLLGLSGHREVADIYAKEAAFLFWLKADKNVIVRSIRDVTETGPRGEHGASRRWCVNALERVCDAKDETDSLFTLVFVGSPVFLFLLYL